MSLEVVDVASSTQDLVKARLLSGEDSAVYLLAKNQTEGRGRFGREWISEPEDSLTMSLSLPEWNDHQKPWLIGMMFACAVAGALNLRLRWPNDLSINRKKVGGILTEIVEAGGVRKAILGVGVNLNQDSLPEKIAEFATSIRMERGKHTAPETAAQLILDRLESMPKPTSWSEIAPIWSLYDETPGKRYQLPTGEEAVAIAVGPEGELICSVEGETRSVMAANALLG